MGAWTDKSYRNLHMNGRAWRGEGLPAEPCQIARMFVRTQIDLDSESAYHIELAPDCKPPSAEIRTFRSI